METPDNCRERAQDDRSKAATAETPRQREIYLRSALQWEGMAAMMLEKRRREDALRDKLKAEKAAAL